MCAARPVYCYKNRGSHIGECDGTKGAGGSPDVPIPVVSLSRLLHVIRCADLWSRRGPPPYCDPISVSSLADVTAWPEVWE